MAASTSVEKTWSRSAAFCGIIARLASRAAQPRRHKSHESDRNPQLGRRRARVRHWTELTPQALYDKLTLAGPQPVVELASRSRQPVPRPRPDPLAAARPQPDRPAGGDHARAGRRAGARDGALQPHQPGLSPAEGVPGEHAEHLGAPARRACWASMPVAYFSAEFGMHESVPIYSRRPGRALGRPHQERQRPGRAAGGHRPVLRPGLFQAAPRRRRLAAARSTSTRRSRTCRWSRPVDPRASRSRSRSKPAPAGCSPRCG